MQQPLGQVQRLVGWGFVADDQELLASPAAHGVHLPGTCLQQPGKVHQNFVPHEVAHVVVDGLEVVNVEQDDGQRALVPLRTRQLNVKRVVEPVAVGQTRQLVCDRQVLQLLVQHPELAHPPQAGAPCHGHERDQPFHQCVIGDDRRDGLDFHVLFNDAGAVLRGQRGHAFVEQVAQRHLGLEHANAKQVVIARHLAGNFQVEPTFLLDSVRRHDERTQRHVGLALADQAHGFCFRTGLDDGQRWKVALQTLLHGGACGQGHGFALQS